MYKALFRVFFSKLDPETAHHLVANGLEFASRIGVLRAAKRPRPIVLGNLRFENRLGLAAGFDKNARLIKAMHALGFGHVEIGTVTPKPQPGNPKKRMFRLLEQRALINRMGFNNDGADIVAGRLKAIRNQRNNLPVIGVNIGKNKDTSELDAALDYAYCAKALAHYADYLVVNVSSPNTPGLRSLQQVQSLRPILQAVKANSGDVPVLVKVAPDLADEDLIDVLDLIKDLKLSGIIAANTTIRRDFAGDAAVMAELGGLSGPMLFTRMIAMLRIVRQHLDARFLVIAVGGIETRGQAEEALASGADLVQGYTALVYHGPFWPRRVAIAA